MEGIVRQLSKNAEQNTKHYSELLQAISARPIAVPPASPPEVVPGNIESILSKYGSAETSCCFQSSSSSFQHPKYIYQGELTDYINLSISQVKIFTEHAGPIWSLKVFSDLLISGSSDKTIKVIIGFEISSHLADMGSHNLQVVENTRRTYWNSSLSCFK